MRRGRPDSAWRRVCVVRVRRAAQIVGIFCVIHTLSGCTLESQKPDLALDTPGKYRAARGAADAAVPKLDWWRGFRSKELVSLIEDAQAHNFDIAVAVAQIQQADAQVRIAGAPLFPAIDLGGSAKVTQATTGGNGVLNAKSSVSTLYSTSLSASYVLDFWGKNQSSLVAVEEGAVASRYNKRGRHPHRHQYGRQYLFSDPWRPGSSAHPAQGCRGFEPHPRSDHAAVQRRNGVADQRCPAAERGGIAARIDPAGRGDAAAEPVRARGAGRTGARAVRRSRRQHDAGRRAARHSRPAVRAPQPAARPAPGRGAALRRQLQRPMPPAPPSFPTSR